MGSILYGTAMHIRKQATIDAARITQASGNEKRGAETALQQFNSSLANRRAMGAAGKQINAGNENIARNLSATTAGNLQGRLKAAEELGASISDAASAGVGGSSVDAFNATLRLQQSMKEEGQDRSTRSDLITASTNQGEALTNAAATLDNNVYRANIDYTKYEDDHAQSTMSKVFTVAAAAAATYFGGPQAGQAVIGMSEAAQAAKNGNFAQASSSAMGSVQAATSAYKDTRSMGGSYWKSTTDTLNSGATLK